jgi:hypothetical protein
MMTMLLRWFFRVVLAILVARLLRGVGPQLFRPRPSGFDPAAGSGHPSSKAGGRERAPVAPAGDIVDGDYEDLPTARRP